MMPDLDRYATTVLAAYAVSLALLLLIGALSWSRSRRVRRRLAALEAARTVRSLG